MRWDILIAAVLVSIVLSLILSRVTHGQVYFVFLPPIFAPLVFGGSRSTRRRG